MDSLAKSFETAIVDLEDMHEHTEKKPTIRILNGKKGIQSVFYDVLDTLKK